MWYNGVMNKNENSSTYGEFVFDMKRDVPLYVGMLMANMVMSATAKYYPEATTTMACNPKKGVVMKVHTPRLCNNHEAVCRAVGADLSDELCKILWHIMDRTKANEHNDAIVKDTFERVDRAIKRFAIRIREVHAVSHNHTDDDSDAQTSR